MKLKCPVCNKSVPTYTVNGKIHCAICNDYIMDDNKHIYPEGTSKEAPSDKTSELETHSKKLCSSHTKKESTRLTCNCHESSYINNQNPENSISFDVNKDGYYNDVPPEILSEIEHLPKEIFLKITAGVLAIIGSIIFLIFYF